MNRLVALATLVGSAHSHSSSEWSQRTIYQVLTDRLATDTSNTGTEACKDLTTYCGGTWKGIEAQLDYVAGMGFDAIWISPMPENMGNDYHGYAFLDLYKLNSHFGTEDDLKSFVAAAHERDIWVMLDVVGNHVAPVDLSFELVNPFNSSEYYHSKCQINDWDNQEEVENCRLANLPDLDQNNAFVRSTLVDWVSTLGAKYGFDGLRVDTIPEVHPDFWSEFTSAAGMYCVGEVFNGDIGYVSAYQNYVDGVLSYPLYFTMRDVFGSKHSMYALEGLLGPSGTYATYFKDVNLLGTFIDNHDNPRFLYDYNNVISYKNALAMTLFTTGIPIVYYGTEQAYHGGADPANRESLWPNYNRQSDLYLYLQQLIATRKSYKVYAYSQVQRYASDDFYAFSRGEVLVCLTNSGGSDVTKTVSYLPFEQGDVVCNVLAENDCLTVSNSGITVTLTGGLPKIYVTQQA